MSTASDFSRMTREEYLAFERDSETKHEFLDGEVFAMSGASLRHNYIAGNLFAGLHARLQGTDCSPFIGDMRVKVDPTGLYTYPDVVVACDEPQFEDAAVDTLLTPTVIIEVLSDSTKNYDRGGKWRHYRQIPSLKHYLLVSQDSMEIEMYTRNDDDSWRLTDHRPTDDVVLTAIDCRLKWDEVYARVTFEPPQSAEASAEKNA